MSKWTNIQPRSGVESCDEHIYPCFPFYELKTLQMYLPTEKGAWTKGLERFLRFLGGHVCLEAGGWLWLSFSAISLHYGLTQGLFPSPSLQFWHMIYLWIQSQLSWLYWMSSRPQGSSGFQSSTGVTDSSWTPFSHILLQTPLQIPLVFTSKEFLNVVVYEASMWSYHLLLLLCAT